MHSLILLKINLKYMEIVGVKWISVNGLTCTQLLNLGMVHVEGAVNPGQQFMATEVVTSR